MKKLALPLTLLVVSLAVTVLTVGCRQSPSEITHRPLSVRELLQNPEYDSELRIFGHISELDQVSPGHFQLESGDAIIEVRRSTVTDSDGTGSSPASMGSIKNGDWVVATGFLKRDSAAGKRDYFLSHSVLLTKGSCTGHGCPLPEVIE